ncbi:PadR family transcriptional regulator [Actinoplanes sp. NPDC049118]|uniref:PadR family transcriptional regulator n=1 Tax=Actinoplanes sp. NPDC049118 TaxID=3155769 RepID=UPI0033EC2C41
MTTSMREPTFWILTVLASAPHHGYGLIREAARLSDDRVRLQAGTLYAALDRLGAEGLVELDREEIVDGRARRYYRLTDRGAAALDAEAARLRANAEAARVQLAARKGFGPATATMASA